MMHRGLPVGLWLTVPTAELIGGLWPHRSATRPGAVGPLSAGQDP